MTATAATSGLSAGPITPVLLLAFMLLAGIAGGYAARFIRIPRVVGFLVAGVILKQLVSLYMGYSLDDRADARTEAAALGEALRPLSYLALGLILFSVGTALELGRLRKVGPGILRISLLDFAFVCGLVAAGVWLLSITLMGMTLAAGGVLAVLLGVVSVATAPAATLLVLREYGAKGPVSDSILALTGLNNIFVITVFHVLLMLLAASGAVGVQFEAERWLWFDVLMTTFGSAALGLVLGLGLSILRVKVSLAEMLLLFFGVLLTLGFGEQWLRDHLNLSFNFLLTCLFAGAIFASLALDPGRFLDLLETMCVPIFTAFFVLAGFNLHLEELWEVGLLGIVYVGLRLLGKYLAGRVGVRWAGLKDHLPETIGIGLLCQAGVAIGLAEFLVSVMADQELARRLQTLVLGAIAVFELSGPIALKWVAVRAGEVKAIYLLRREPIAQDSSTSPSRVVLGGLLRWLTRRSKTGRPAAEPLLTRHVMRTNVKCLRPEANLDEVLHFVERSSLHRFPVADEEGRLVGVINFDDLSAVIYDPLLLDLVTASDLAEPDPAVVRPGDSLDHVVETCRKARLGSVLVVDDLESRRLIGVVELRDALRALHRPAVSAGSH